MGPRMEGTRTWWDSGDLTPSEWYDQPPKDEVFIHNGMTHNQRAAANMENLRRRRATRIFQRIQDPVAAMPSRVVKTGFNPFTDLTPGAQSSQTNSGLTPGTGSSAQSSKPSSGLTPSFDPRGIPYDGLGMNFESLDDINSEDDTMYTPPCPRYDDFAQYILDNRAQGSLCFDTMTKAISEPTLYQYIQLYGGLQITPQELRDFLQNCNTRQEYFR